MSTCRMEVEDADESVDVEEVEDTRGGDVVSVSRFAR